MITAYLNGEYLPLEQARVPAMDRGFLFGDGVYEVIPVYHGKPFRLEQHFKRLEYSLREIRLAQAIDYALWEAVCVELIARNGGNIDQSLYLQITRGVAPVRDHLFPDKVEPTLFAYSKPFQPPAYNNHGISAVTLPDIRWKQCNIKAITLLANVLLRQQASEMGAAEAILINNGYVIEGTASNLFMVKDGIIMTPPPGPQMLGGITRELILELASQRRLPYDERPIAESDLLQAEEIWITSSLREIQPVVQLNNQPVGSGRPGSVWQQMQQYYQDYKASLKEECHG